MKDYVVATQRTLRALEDKGWKRVGHFRFKWTKKLDDWLYNNNWFRKVK